MKSILAIGTTCDIKKNLFTGQSIMFDGIVNVASCKYKCDVIDITSVFGDGLIGKVINYFIVLNKILFKCLTHKYSLVYVITSQSRFGFYRDYLMTSITKLFGIPAVTHQYGANYHQLLDSLNKKDYERLYKMLDYVFAVIVEGEYMKSQFSFYKGYESKVKVIPNGLPLEGKHILQTKTYDSTKPFVMFFLSNMIYSKGYFDVLKAVDILVNQEKLDIKCVFAGKFMPSADDSNLKISTKEDFDLFILEHNLGDRVEYHPGLFGDAKDKYFSQSNVFILPTYYINEGQPVSIIEAMAYGCVPIVTNYRHISMMVNDANGCFVKPQSPDSISFCIKELMQNPSLYANKSQQSIIDYQEKFKFEKYATKVLNIFESIIQ